MPTCQLCGKLCPKLRNSHIVPKLVYKRIKGHPSSRFRDLNNINEIMQDGEKHDMLCESCEQKFSKLEDKFARDFLDKYLQSAVFQTTTFSTGWLGNYLASVAWRVLRDDLFRLNSFADAWHRSVFEEFEQVLRSHFIENPPEDSLPKEISNYVFKLNSISSDKKYATLLEGLIWGYPYYDEDFNLFLVCTYYAGMFCITVYSPSPPVIVIKENGSLIALIKNKILPIKSKIRLLLRKQLIQNSVLIAKGYAQNLSSELQRKIDQFYQSKENK